jgi:hypothetical protein
MGQASAAQPPAAVEEVAGQPVSPYPPSFVDRFISAIERFPWPYWAAYLLLFGLEVAVLHVIAWLIGYATITFIPILMFFPFWLWFPLASISYLNRFARQAVQSFCTLLEGEQAAKARLEYDFTVMPARPVLINSLLWVILYFVLWLFAFEATMQIWPFHPVLFAAVFIAGLGTFFIGSAGVYHAIRQLRLVNRALDQVENLNLFQLDPVYAFSRLTARIGISWLILLTFTVWLLGLRVNNPLILALYAQQILLALGAFVLPLWNIHTRLVEEKRALQAAANRRLETNLQRLHTHLDAENLAPVGDINTALAGLALERETLARINTWPWRAETLRAFVSALILPVVLILIQLGLDLWLGR